MKWHDATKVLPASDTAVLVRDGDDKSRYVLCHLFEDSSDVCFLPYEAGCDCVVIKEGVLWTKIKPPKE